MIKRGPISSKAVNELAARWKSTQNCSPQSEWSVLKRPVFVFRCILIIVIIIRRRTITINFLYNSEALDLAVYKTVIPSVS